jgi:hypothetical protein
MTRRSAPMNWEAVGAVAEIVGTLTVIVTIFYLAIQVRHAAAVAKAAAQQSAAQMSIETVVATLDSQILSRASMKATMGEELNPEERSNYLRWVLVRMRVAENSHYQFQQGLLPPEAWRGQAAIIVAHLGPGSLAKSHWENVSMAYSESFVEEVKKILEWASKRGDRPITEAEERAEFIAMLKSK